MCIILLVRNENVEGSSMYLVFDVCATFVKYAWMTEDGFIEEKGKLPTPNKLGDGVDDFLESIGSIYDKYKLVGSVEGIAMGLPGQVDVEKGIVYGGGGLRYMDDVPLGRLLSSRCDGVKVSLENDAKCTALAEVWLGNAKNVQDACVLVFGTGIGGGIIKNRKVHRGTHLLAGEISYSLEGMTRDDLNAVTPIEKIISLEEANDRIPFVQAAKCSTFGLSWRVARAKGIPVDEVDGEKIYQWVEAGDPVATKVLEDVYFDIAKMCINLYVTFDPEVILIGGGISAQPAFVAGIQKYIDRLKPLTKVYASIKIDVCKFLNDSNLIGALYNFKQLYEK